MPKSCMVVPLLLQELEKELEKAHDVTFQHSPTLQQLSADLGTLCTVLVECCMGHALESPS